MAYAWLCILGIGDASEPLCQVEIEDLHTLRDLQAILHSIGILVRPTGRDCGINNGHSPMVAIGQSDIHSYTRLRDCNLVIMSGS